MYVGKKASTNFGIGMRALTWGWKSNSHGDDVKEAMAELRKPRGMNYLVFARGLRTPNPPEGWPRTPANDPAWAATSLESITLAQITGPLREDTEQLWPDDLYPFRVPLGSPVELPALPAGGLSDEVVLTIRRALLLRGLPVLGAPPIDESDIPDEDTPEDDVVVPDRLLTGLDSLDGIALVLVRREQKRLRREMFGQAKSYTCSLCHRELPVSLLRLAHIKRRTEATTEERLNAANTMAACTLGCDELFERGYLVVDVQGLIHRNTAAPVVTVDLDGALSGLDGKKVLNYDSAAAPFFAAHADRHTRSAASGNPSSTTG
ncbi:hypothetical protein L6E12_09710 [Actinokineospora sp. PR83]|uniref:hypothetical protein n=1 Tax=Actinokineospora sp. PR83 TaxID=2884908 RepID=UPI001F2FC4FC|nr:hypothetical protein [Actinokineospora sp. PR83]MCG8916065.1 hypothetical protein [Actinokineospora sp. PR83]